MLMKRTEDAPTAGDVFAGMIWTTSGTLKCNRVKKRLVRHTSARITWELNVEFVPQFLVKQCSKFSNISCNIRKLLGTSASLVVTSALLVGTRSY